VKGKGDGGEGEGGRRSRGRGKGEERRRPKVGCSAILQKPKKATLPFITFYSFNLFLF
jgi:hypothetical protein